MKMKITGTHLGIAVMVLFFASQTLEADELVMKFKNPSFSGVGTSSHYLTIENQEKSRKDKIKESIEAELLRLKREEDNSTLNKFLRNLESRIYSQLSKQLVDNMFGNEEGADYGVFTIEGNTVTYERIIGEDGIAIIRLTIVDADGSITTIDIPVGVGNIG
jgi:predicted ArsR family transcriptional regulator